MSCRKATHVLLISHRSWSTKMLLKLHQLFKLCYHSSNSQNKCSFSLCLCCWTTLFQTKFVRLSTLENIYANQLSPTAYTVYPRLIKGATWINVPGHPASQLDSQHSPHFFDGFSPKSRHCFKVYYLHLNFSAITTSTFMLLTPLQTVPR